MPAPQLLPHNVQHEPIFSNSLRWDTNFSPKELTSKAQILLYHFCFGNGNPSTRQWIGDFHLSYWSWSGGAQQAKMKKKKQRKFRVADRVWRAPEINLEAAKAAEATFLITSAAESWPETEPAVVSEKWQPKSNTSWTGVTVRKPMSERWYADLLTCRCRSTSYLCMHSYTALVRSPQKCELWIAIAQDAVSQNRAGIIPSSLTHPPFKLPEELFRP